MKYGLVFIFLTALPCFAMDNQTRDLLRKLDSGSITRDEKAELTEVLFRNGDLMGVVSFGLAHPEMKINEGAAGERLITGLDFALREKNLIAIDVAAMLLMSPERHLRAQTLGVLANHKAYLVTEHFAKEVRERLRDDLAADRPNFEWLAPLTILALAATPRGQVPKPELEAMGVGASSDIYFGELSVRAAELLLDDESLTNAVRLFSMPKNGQLRVTVLRNDNEPRDEQVFFLGVRDGIPSFSFYDRAPAPHLALTQMTSLQKLLFRERYLEVEVEVLKTREGEAILRRGKEKAAKRKAAMEKRDAELKCKKPLNPESPESGGSRA